MSIGAAAVTGARHARSGRNGQDAVATWAEGDATVLVVCDGCSAGASSEVGARLGARLVCTAAARRLRAGAAVDDLAMWNAVRDEVVRVIGGIVEHVGGDRAAVVADAWLFTIVAAATRGGRAAIWAIGDGAYAIDGRVTQLGPCPDNAPPYLAYDLLGDPRPAHFAVVPAGWGSLAVATDGALEIDLARLIAPRFASHPDALRRQLALFARPEQRIDWDARQVARTPAQLQDDCAIALVFAGGAS